MPATSKVQIYAFESNFERAVQAVLDGAGMLHSYIQRANDSLPDSRIEITFAGGEAINEAIMEDRTQVYDFYSGTLVLRIVTIRPEDQPSMIPGVATMHEEWSAHVRALLEERASPFTQVNLPYYTVRTIRPVGTQRDLDPKWLEDYTRMEFAMQFGIRSDAWPA
jgi:hypothetical protein